MKNLINAITAVSILMGTALVHAQDTGSQRIPQLSNDKVKVWKTIVFPSSKQALPMHRHERDRVVVALTDGEFKSTNDKGEVHYIKLKKDTAYYLKKDKPNELHNDENISHHTIKVMVIEIE